MNDPGEAIGPTIFMVKLVFEANPKLELYVTVLPVLTEMVFPLSKPVFAAGEVVAAVQVAGSAVSTCQFAVVVKVTLPFDR